MVHLRNLCMYFRLVCCWRSARETTDTDVFLPPIYKHMRIKSRKSLVKIITLLEDNGPTESRMKCLKHQFFKQTTAVIFRHGPFFVMVVDNNFFRAGRITSLCGLNYEFLQKHFEFLVPNLYQHFLMDIYQNYNNMYNYMYHMILYQELVIVLVKL